jgi:hypothetical protein
MNKELLENLEKLKKMFVLLSEERKWFFLITRLLNM